MSAIAALAMPPVQMPPDVNVSIAQWLALPPELVLVADLRYTTHNGFHLAIVEDLAEFPNNRPIHALSLERGGPLYVQDGRHRAARHQLDGKPRAWARVLRRHT